ncbi:MAG: serine/threonine-protein phosphatase [Deltaproteobacteria bacterium]|nr:serine/threonine-protein phosphatase [Deltaproteobacteria bacterium]
MQLQSFGFSDAGKIRDNNEDSYLCNEKEDLFLVADGMGGHVSGEIASRLAVENIEEFVVRSRAEDIEWPVKQRDALSPEQNRLLAAAVFAHRRILDATKKDPSLNGMGTTLSGGTIEGERFAVVNVGDSRIYRVRDGEIRQITKDHSLVGEQERNGMITHDQAREDPRRHILTSALGLMRKKPKIDVFRPRIKPKDLYLICSDGLYNMLEDSKILEIIISIKDESLYKMGLSLALEANLAGGRDNITVVLLSFK